MNRHGALSRRTANRIMIKTFLQCVLFVSVSTQMPDVRADEPSRPPNVLFIAIDDLRAELGCYGLDYVDSPHLDQLANEGTLFTNHFVQVATCGASRYAMLTGRSPSSTGFDGGNAGFYSGRTALRHKQLNGAQSMPELFRRSGYHSVLIGKMTHTADGRVFEYNGRGDGRDEVPFAWDDKATPFGTWKRGWGIFFAYANGRSREDGSGIRDLMEFTVENDDDLPDGLMASAAITKLQQLKNRRQPFFMGLGFFKPHLPFVAPKQDMQAMALRDVPPPPNQQKPTSPYWHRSGEFYKYDADIRKSWPLSTSDAIKCRRAYLACVRYVDRQVGRVLTALSDNGLAENTIVVVWGDHGWHLGDTASWAKHTPFERAMHSTLIIRAPGVGRPGRRCEALVESVDLYPTLMEICGTSFRKTAHPLDGVSLVPLLAGKQDAVREAAVSYWKGAVSVRTLTHRLIVSAKTAKQTHPPELYDIRLTPDPVENLADSNPELVKELSQLVP